MCKCIAAQLTRPSWKWAGQRKINGLKTGKSTVHFVFFSSLYLFAISLFIYPALVCLFLRALSQYQVNKALQISKACAVLFWLPNRYVWKSLGLNTKSIIHIYCVSLVFISITLLFFSIDDIITRNRGVCDFRQITMSNYKVT